MKFLRTSFFTEHLWLLLLKKKPNYAQIFYIFHFSFNKCLYNILFCFCLEKIEITPIHKRGLENNLPSISKTFDLCLFKYHLLWWNLFHYYWYELRKTFSADYCLVIILEKCRYCNDAGKSFAVFYVLIKKLWLSISCSILKAKINAFNIASMYLELIYSYITVRKQRTKMGSSISSWTSYTSIYFRTTFI